VKVSKGQKVPATPPLAVQARLGAAVKAHRQRLGVTQEELAWRADMHRTYIADIERGVRNITLRSIINLAAALQVSVASLLAAPGETVHGANEGPPASEILLVDGNSAEAEQVILALAHAKFTNPVTIARDGEEALDYFFARGRFKGRNITETPQLVLLDLKLPKLDGLEVLRRVRAQEATRAVPVVVLASSRDDRLVAESARMGAEHVIVKPFAVEKLLAILPKLDLRCVIGRVAPSPNGSAAPAP